MCSAYVQTFDRSGGLIPSRRSRRKYGRVATDWDGTTWLMDAPQQKIQASSQATTRLVSIPIACYSAAISSEPGNATGCHRGGIAGRWTKPVAATQFVASRRKPICCGGGDLGNCISA